MRPAGSTRLTAKHARNHRAPVLLLSMPFGPVLWPSLGLSLLKAGLERDGLAAEIRYFTLAFASTIGERAYTRISMTGPLTIIELAGEWVFSGALFDQSEDDVRRYVDEVLVRRAGSRGSPPRIPPRVVSQLLEVRGRVDAFLDRCLDEVVAARPRVVGFTSVFQQHVASLALARRLRQALPDVVIVFGGANVEGVMGAETVRRFPFVDAVVSGEGDLVFPDLVRRALAGEPLAGLQGVRTRAGIDEDFAAGRLDNAPVVRRMDDLPYPDFADYFRQFRATRLARSWIPNVPIETSRGCWWGERSHCTFCGLNGATMAFRSKSAPRALAEMEWLGRRHPGHHMQVVDNILDLAYFKTLLPDLAAREFKLSVFFETKSNLKKEQVSQLARAGVRHIQPGIESFSDPILKLMRKGVSALHNIQLLKWCKQYGVTPYWNVLWGFPGEPPEEYERMAAMVPLLTHLEPPVGLYGVRLDRFSPNHTHAEAMGFTGVRPLPSYRAIYALPDEALTNLAYYFFADYPEHRQPALHTETLLRQIARWRRVQRRSDLFSVDLDDRLVVCDLRSGATRTVTVLDGVDRELYLACDGVTEIGRLAALAGDAAGNDAPAAEARLGALVSAGLMLQDGSRYLNLAIPLGEYSPGAAIVERFRVTASNLGRRTSAGVVIPIDGALGHNGHVNGDRPASRGQGPGTRGRPGKLTPDRFGFDRHGDLVVR